MLNWLPGFNRSEKKKPIGELADKLSQFADLRHSIWRHRKGGVYRIVCVAFREQTMALEIVYEDTNNLVTYIRPHDEFMDGRFERVEADQ